MSGEQKGLNLVSSGGSDLSGVSLEGSVVFGGGGGGGDDDGGGGGGGGGMGGSGLGGDLNPQHADIRLLLLVLLLVLLMLLLIFSGTIVFSR